VFSFGTYSKTTTGVGTSTSYAIPTSWLAAIPSATSGTAKVTVTTYSGSTKIGSAVSKNFTLTVPATVVPTFSSVAVADTTTNQATFGNMVQGKSKAKFTITAAGASGSTIKAYKTVFEGKTYTGATPTTATITKSGTASATITVTDSRGRTASFTKTWTVVAYAAPKITTFTGFRCLADGTENYEGTFLSLAVNYSIASVNSKNTNTYAIEYKATSSTTWEPLTNGTGYALNSTIISENGILSTESSYDVRLSITDSFGTVRSTAEIPTAFTLLDFHKDGRALAFGKVAEKQEGVEFGLPAFFSHAETPGSPIYLQSGQDLDNILEPGFYAIPNTAVSATLLNKPWTATATGGVYVMVEGDGMGKVQIAHRLSKDDGEIYERSYYQSGWGNWYRVHNGRGKVLWTGGYYMTATHTIPLSERVSQQPNGIVLVFSRFSGGEAQNYHWNEFFVSKEWVRRHPGTGHSFLMTNDGLFSIMASKYLYIHDDKIGGNDVNGQSGTGTSGITYQNNAFVLRYVIGV
jgi:hypothetical protein